MKNYWGEMINDGTDIFGELYNPYNKQRSSVIARLHFSVLYTKIDVMHSLTRKNRLIPSLEQAFKNCIEFTSNSSLFSYWFYWGVDLYIKNVKLFMLIT